MRDVILIIVGGIVGALARFIGPARAPGPLFGSVLFGALGAVAGKFIGHVTGFSGGDASADFVTALVGAIVAVGIYHMVALRSRTTG